MSNLSKEAVAALKEAGLTADEALWKHKQSGQWIIRHAACERIAAKRGIVFSPPRVIEADTANGVAVVSVRGYIPDGDAFREEWSIGEASPRNYDPKPTAPAYPWAMAEKRAKDRVILKLINLHGEIYSEEEADDFKESAPKEKRDNDDELRGPLNITELKKRMREFAGDLAEVSDTDEFHGLMQSYEPVLEQCKRDLPRWYDGDPDSDVQGAKERINQKYRDLQQKEQAA